MARDAEAHHAERIMSMILAFPLSPQTFSKARKLDSY